jgi:hypothetical protein
MGRGHSGWIWGHFGSGIRSLEPVEKLIFFRLIKNAQMQVQQAKSRLRAPASLSPAVQAGNPEE